uniref:Uncharacterized protein n=1 Tax=Octopus bimaculoides TaxID=37653 RepID=A0A0L8H449_OCTBM
MKKNLSVKFCNSLRSILLYLYRMYHSSLYKCVLPFYYDSRCNCFCHTLSDIRFIHNDEKVACNHYVSCKTNFCA